MHCSIAARDTAQAVRRVCLRLPSAEEFLSHGSLNVRVGGKTSASYTANPHALRAEIGSALVFRAPPTPLKAAAIDTFCLWVGVAQPGRYLADRRFRIPACLRHGGWISLDVHARCDWREVTLLALGSYRHCASRTVLKMLPASD